MLLSPIALLAQATGMAHSHQHPSETDERRGLQLIAAEKAGIFKAGSRAFTVPQQPSATQVLKVCDRSACKCGFTLSILYGMLRSRRFDLVNKAYGCSQSA